MEIVQRPVNRGLTRVVILYWFQQVILFSVFYYIFKLCQRVLVKVLWELGNSRNLDILVERA